MNEHERAELARLRQAFSQQSWEPSAEDCLDSETLWASAAGELDPEENEAVLLHVASCGQCASIWRLAREMISPSETVDDPPAPFQTVQHPWVWRRPGFLAAAAVLIAGLGLGTGLLISHRYTGRQSVYRQQQPTFTIMASPATRKLPRAGTRLRWNAGPSGTRYDLTVTGVDLHVLTVVNGLTSPEYLVPEQKIPASTRTILWRVTAHLPADGIVRSGTFRSRIVN